MVKYKQITNCLLRENSKVYLDQMSLNEIIFYKFSIIYALLKCEEYVDNLISILKYLSTLESINILSRYAERIKWKFFFLFIMKNLFLMSKSDHY